MFDAGDLNREQGFGDSRGDYADSVACTAAADSTRNHHRDPHRTGGDCGGRDADRCGLPAWTQVPAAQRRRRRPGAPDRQTGP
jgi:hypothetical protein